MEETVQPSFNIADFMQVPVPKESKFQHEFQEICSEMTELFGKRYTSRIWSMPYKVGFEEHRARRALEITKSRGVLKFEYFLGVMKRLP